MQKAMSFLFIVVIMTQTIADECGVVPMTQWAGRESLREEKLSLPIGLVVVQHTATPECSSDDACESRVKSILEYHQQYLGFTDIGLSFLVGGNGKVYEGAGWERVGAHTRGYNNKALGISFVGDFRDKLPTTEALEAVKSLLTCGMERKYLKYDYKVVGHLQLAKTQSPGEALQSNLKTWQHWSDNFDN